MEPTTVNYELVKETAFKKSMSIIINGIAVKNPNTGNEFLKKHQLFLLGCICSKDMGCTCDLFEIIWVLSDDILSLTNTGKKTEDGQEMLHIAIKANANVLLEKTTSVKADMLSALSHTESNKRRISMDTYTKALEQIFNTCY